MSSQGDKHVMAEVLHVGAADFLLKPLRRNELRTIWTHVWRRWVRALFAPFALRRQADDWSLTKHEFCLIQVGMQLSNAAQGQAVLPNALVGRVPLSRGSGDSGASGEKADSSGASAPDSLNEHALAADSGPMPVHQRTVRLRRAPPRWLRSQLVVERLVSRRVGSHSCNTHFSSSAVQGRQAGDHSCAFVADQSNLVELDSAPLSPERGFGPWPGP